MTQSLPSNLRQWLRWAPVGLLLVAIASQAVLMATVDEDRQAGSGFAMFSSVDFGGSRAVVIQAQVDDVQVRLDPPARFDEHINELTMSPTQARADELAQALEQLSWSIVDGTATESGDTTVESVLVAVRGLTADGRTLRSQVLAEGNSQ